MFYKQEYIDQRNSVTLKGLKLKEYTNDMLGIPKIKTEIQKEFRGKLEIDNIVVEKWVWASEPGSKVTSELYRPNKNNALRPALVITCGHGGSKSQPHLPF